MVGKKPRSRLLLVTSFQSWFDRSIRMSVGSSIYVLFPVGRGEAGGSSGGGGDKEEELL